MPLYDFRCTECRTVTEKIVKSDVTIIECPNCNSIARRQLAAPGGFSLQGDGFYKPSPKPIDGAA